MQKVIDIDKMTAALDIGSEKLVIALAKVLDGKVCFSFVKEIKSSGIKNGGIANIALLKGSIDYLLDIFEAENNIRIHKLVISISGVSLISYNLEGQTNIKSAKIQKKHIIQAIIQAKDSYLPDNREVVHSLPQKFIVDEQEIDNPVGLIGTTLKARFHIISFAKSVFQNLQEIFDIQNIEVESTVASVYASSLAASRDHERKAGICVLDIGAGKTEVAIYQNGNLIHSSTIPIGGNSIDSDLAYFLKSTLEQAKQVKKQVNISKVYEDDEYIKINETGEAARKSDVVNVIQERIRQIIDIVKEQTISAGFNTYFPKGFTICGGVANTEGIADFFSRETRLQTHISELNIDSFYNDPKYATICGLFLYAEQVNKNESIILTQNNKLYSFLLLLKYKISKLI